MTTDDARLITNAGYLIALLYCMRGGFVLARELIGLLREFVRDWRAVNKPKPDSDPDKDKPK